jgi:arsenate reductase
MAEGLVNHLLPGEWVASSAGTDPTGSVHPLAIEVMAEIGIDIPGQRSKPVSEFRDATFDLVITLCDDAEENCPLWLGPGRRAHLAFPDPTLATGSRAERLAVFRQVRDDMRHRVPEFLRQGVRIPA